MMTLEQAPPDHHRATDRIGDLARAVQKVVHGSLFERDLAAKQMVRAAEPFLKHSDRIKAAVELTTLLEAVRDGNFDDPEPEVTAAFLALEIERALAEPEPETDAGDFLPPELDEFLSINEPDYAWTIEGLAEVGDRIILTGVEGQGKTTFLRQLAVQLASGIHPFTHSPINPVRVLYVDSENSARQIRRKLRPLRKEAGNKYVGGNLRIHVVTDPLEIANEPTYNALALRVNAHRPDVIIIGPLYKMHSGDPTKEEPARALAAALDRLRTIHGSVLIIEAHSPYPESAKTRRLTRPYGASLWSRWPEFGIYLAPDGKLEHWRGPRDEREWPQALERGEPWPWMPTDAPAARQGPTECTAAVLEAVNAHPDVEHAKTNVPALVRARSGRGYRDKTIYDSLAILTERGEIECRTEAGNRLFYRSKNVTTEDLLDF